MYCRSFFESPYISSEWPESRRRNYPSCQVVVHSRLSLRQGEVWLPWAAMVEKSFISVSVALSRSWLKTSTNSMAHVELKSQISSSLQSLLDGAWLRTESGRSCWVVTSWGEREWKNIPGRAGYNSSLLGANLCHVNQPYNDFQKKSGVWEASAIIAASLW